MAKLVRFEPDPESDGDLGTATFDDGTSLYTAQSLIPPSLKGPDLRFAGPGAAEAPNASEMPATAPPVSDAGGFSAPNGGTGFALPPVVSAPEPPVPDISGAGGAAAQAAPSPAPEAAIDAQVSNALAHPIVTRAPSEAQPAPQLPTLGYLADPRLMGQQPGQPGQPTPSAANSLIDLAAAGRYVPGVNPQAMLQSGVMVPSGERTVTEAGVPYSPAEARVRELANQKVVAAQIATAESQAARAEQQRVAAEAQLPALQKQAAENQAHAEAIQASYQRERAQLQAEIDDFDRSAKVDPDRWFTQRGAWGQIGAVIGQALGAYAATASGGTNWAQEVINREIDRDISAQMATLNQQRMGQKNALSRLADRYGDVQEAQAALKVAQQQIADKQWVAFAAATQRDDIMNAAQEQVAKNQQQRVQEELDLYHASIGKQTQSQESRFVVPQAGGRQPWSPEQLLTLMKAGLTAQELQTALNRGAGGPPSIRPFDPANPLFVDLGNGHGGYARKPTEAEFMRRKKAEFGDAMESLNKMDELLNDPSRVVGIGRVGTNAYNYGQTLQSQAETRLAKAYGGVITNYDRAAAKLELPDVTATNVTGGERARLQAARDKLIREWTNLVSATITPYEPEAPLRAKTEEPRD